MQTQTEPRCQTYIWRQRKWLLLYILLTAVCILMVTSAFLWTRSRGAEFRLPNREATAAAGVPVVAEEYAYTELTVEDGYVIALCGFPKHEDQRLFLNLTNPAGNTVLFRCEVLNSDSQVIGSLGILSPGEYVESVPLKRLPPVENCPIRLKIISYDLQTGQSRGNVNLDIVVDTRD